MIKEQDLTEAIAECQGQSNPNANTCIKLAAYYVIQDHMKKEPEMPKYSFSMPPSVSYDSGTEFSDRVQEMDMNDVLTVMDELMTTLSVVNPRLYASVMRKLVV